MSYPTCDRHPTQAFHPARITRNSLHSNILLISYLFSISCIRNAVYRKQNKDFWGRGYPSHQGPHAGNCPLLESLGHKVTLGLTEV